MNYDEHANVPIPASKKFPIPSEGAETIWIDYDPVNYDTPEKAAKAFYEALKPAVIAYGQNPDSELAIWSPEKSRERGWGNNWTVLWEAGPYYWGVNVSLGGLWNSDVSPGWYTEPNYSFDVCFVET